MNMFILKGTKYKYLDVLVVILIIVGLFGMNIIPKQIAYADENDEFTDMSIVIDDTLADEQSEPADANDPQAEGTDAELPEAELLPDEEEEASETPLEQEVPDRLDWQDALGNMGWSLPGDSQSLVWTNTSPNSKTSLDYAYMQVNNGGENVTLYFLSSSTQKSFITAQPGAMSFADIPGALVGTYGNDNDKNGPVKYIVWKVTMPASKSLQGNALIVNTGQGGHTINYSPFSITNLNYETQHYVFDTDPMKAKLKMTTPGVGTPGMKVAAKAVNIYGYTNTYVAGATVDNGIVPNSGTLALKLYYKKMFDESSIIIQGVEATAEYTGSTISLSAASGGVGADALYNIMIPGHDPGNGEYYRLVADINADVSGIYVGEYEQMITIRPGYKVGYRGAKNSENVKPGEWEDVTDLFEAPVIVNGKLTIVPNSTVITITANSAVKVYDGFALIGSSFIIGELPEGVDKVMAVVGGSQTDAGFSASEVTGYSLWKNDWDVTDCFVDAELIAGKLAVTPRPVAVKASSGSKVYDGTELTNDNFTYEAYGGMLAGSDRIAIVTVAGTQTHVLRDEDGGVIGSANVASNAVIIGGASGNANTTANYDVSYIDGELIVEPAVLNITVLDLKVMQGSPVPDYYELTAEHFVGGDGPEVIGGAAVYVTSYTPAARVGQEFLVELSGLTAQDYEIVYYPGIIGVVGAGGSTTNTANGGGATGGGATGGGATGGGAAGGGATGGGAADGGGSLQPAIVTTSINGVEMPLGGFVNPTTPEGTPQIGFSSWALLNLILTIITGLIMVAMIITDVFRRSVRLISVFAAVTAIVFFTFTQDMTLQMGFVDHWTIWHIAIIAATVFVALLSKLIDDETDETPADETV